MRLTEDGTRVPGSILNEWDPRKTTRAGYSPTYRYYQSDVYRG